MKKIVFLSVTSLLSYTYSFAQQKEKNLPEPYATKSAQNFSKWVGWDKGNMPQAPVGFTVTKYADDFQNPRWMYVLPNGDILVAESNSNMSFIKQVGAEVIGAASSHDTKKSADRIALLRDTNKDGIPETRSLLLENLNQPFGMVLIGKWLYVANTDAIVRFPYTEGDMHIDAKPEKIADLNGGKRHWTKSLITNADKTKLYVGVGSASNAGEEGIEAELMRACILEMNPDGSKLRVYASGLRNPVGMDWAPGTKTLWTSVNERDELGDDLVPDYLTSVKDGGFYGWPYSYWGQHIDPRVKEPKLELVKKAIVPEVDLGSHTASLGLEFYTGKAFPAKYHGGAFVAQHGSWNRSKLSGYKVVFVPFKDGKPAGPAEDFLTGFVADLDKDQVYGRPTGLVFMPDGSMLLTDDISNTIWKVQANK
jgi:glucose/arabinose dehydrogenase